jgi:hypothetical protein
MTTHESHESSYSAPSNEQQASTETANPNAERKPRYPSNQRRRKRFNKNPRHRRPAGSGNNNTGEKRLEGEDIYNNKSSSTEE